MKKILCLFFWVISIGINAQPIAHNDTKVQVLWRGIWYPAVVIESKESLWKIHYDHYGPEWDEWVGRDRIKFAWNKGDRVQVSWKGTWYQATIIEVAGEKYKIHYDGYGTEWDEWVSLDRMKGR